MPYIGGITVRVWKRVFFGVFGCCIRANKPVEGYGWSLVGDCIDIIVSARVEDDYRIT